jgi:hypothetical protein
MILRVALAFAALCAAVPARAHDQWGDGGDVPKWVKAQCCGPEDVHWYKPEAVMITAQGYVLPDYPEPIPMDKALPALANDGLYWAFFKRLPNGGVTIVYCFFIPPSGV